jgi:hypothetical protein
MGQKPKGAPKGKSMSSIAEKKRQENFRADRSAHEDGEMPALSDRQAWPCLPRLSRMGGRRIGLRYSFEINVGKAVQEVGLDAR